MRSHAATVTRVQDARGSSGEYAVQPAVHMQLVICIMAEWTGLHMVGTLHIIIGCKKLDPASACHARQCHAYD